MRRDVLRCGAMPGRIWPARSRAAVAIVSSEETAVSRLSGQLFGKRFPDWRYAGLGGAPDAAEVQVSPYQNALHLDVGDPNHRYRAVSLVRRVGSVLVLIKDGFHIHDVAIQRRGLGLLIFHRQLQNAQALGVRYIFARAGRDAGENGYYTWPRFGFDGPLARGVREILPPPLNHARSVLDLVDCPEGRRWWREFGHTIDVRFDVADGSRSQCVFERYLRNRFWRVAKNKG